MNVTLELQESVLVQRPIEDVFAYVSDFNKAKDWRAEVVESSMSTPRMQLGTRLREVADVLGRRVENNLLRGGPRVAAPMDLRACLGSVARVGLVRPGIEVREPHRVYVPNQRGTARHLGAGCAPPATVGPTHAANRA